MASLVSDSSITIHLPEDPKEKKGKISNSEIYPLHRKRRKEEELNDLTPENKKKMGITFPSLTNDTTISESLTTVTGPNTSTTTSPDLAKDTLRSMEKKGGRNQEEPEGNQTHGNPEDGAPSP